MNSKLFSCVYLRWEIIKEKTLRKRVLTKPRQQPRNKASLKKRKSKKPRSRPRKKKQVLRSYFYTFFSLFHKVPLCILNDSLRYTCTLNDSLAYSCTTLNNFLVYTCILNATAAPLTSWARA